MVKRKSLTNKNLP